MADERIYILTGEIHSGKTTSIAKWIEGRTDVFGILTPDIRGERFFMNAQTKEQFTMEAATGEANVLQVGKYNFSKETFEKASRVLREGLLQNWGWLIVDEIGHLELKQQGFYEVIKEILGNDNPELKKLLVVRQSLVEQVIAFFKIKDYTIITSMDNI
ncbi:MAG TPA: nucleoside-triphosphatase [Segetibacter sp.]|jgi:nucleoside-triphosphatase THEP1